MCMSLHLLTACTPIGLDPLTAQAMHAWANGHDLPSQPGTEGMVREASMDDSQNTGVDEGLICMFADVLTEEDKNDE